MQQAQADLSPAGSISSSLAAPLEHSIWLHSTYYCKAANPWAILVDGLRRLLRDRVTILRAGLDAQGCRCRWCWREVQGRWPPKPRIPRSPGNCTTCQVLNWAGLHVLQTWGASARARRRRRRIAPAAAPPWSALSRRFPAARPLGGCRRCRPRRWCPALTGPAKLVKPSPFQVRPCCPLSCAPLGVSPNLIVRCVHIHRCCHLLCLVLVNVATSPAHAPCDRSAGPAVCQGAPGTQALQCRPAAAARAWEHSTPGARCTGKRPQRPWRRAYQIPQPW